MKNKVIWITSGVIIVVFILIFLSVRVRPQVSLELSLSPIETTNEENLAEVSLTIK